MTDLSFLLTRPDFANMTPAEQDSDQRDMASYLSCTSFVVDRCDSPHNHTTALWIMDKDGKTQVASVSRNAGTWSKYAWTVQKLHRSQPITNLSFETLLEAAAYVVRCC